MTGVKETSKTKESVRRGRGFFGFREKNNHEIYTYGHTNHSLRVVYPKTNLTNRTSGNFKSWR